MNKKNVNNIFVKNLIALTLIVVTSSSSYSAEFSYNGYLRSPVGINAQGGKFIALTNPGSKGNEFRIGNETPYLEVSFTAKILSAVKSSDPFFETNLTLAYSPGFDTQYENIPSTSSYIAQAYVKGGNVDGIQATYWAGKRFYRENDIHMNDFFYIADMSGSGGGVEAIPLANGDLSVAYLFSSDSTVASTSGGYPTKQALDFRLKNFMIDQNNSMMFWVAEAYTAPGNGTGKVYAATNGTALGVLLRHKFEQGFNDAAIIYGNSVMESLTLDSDQYSLDAGGVSGYSRTRLVEHYSSELSGKWGVHAAIVYDSLTGVGSSNQAWTSIGFRPVYYFTDHMHLVMQFGHSSVESRTLERFTIAPEVAIGRGLFQRPVIRFFVTETMWNDANKSLSDSNSLVSRVRSTTKALDNRNDEFQMGFEGEVWF